MNKLLLIIILSIYYQRAFRVEPHHEFHFGTLKEMIHNSFIKEKGKNIGHYLFFDKTGI